MARQPIVTAAFTTLAAIAVAGCQSGNSSGDVAKGRKSGGDARLASSTSNNDVTPADKMFLVFASGTNQAEIATAELALKKSDNPQVQQYANQIITDHQQAEDRLQAIAKAKGIKIDAEIPEDARSASYELGKLDGAMFDQQYFLVNHGSHMKTVAAFQHASQHATDPDVRAFAAQLLPTLQSHTRMADRNISSATGGMRSSGGMDGMSR